MQKRFKLSWTLVFIGTALIGLYFTEQTIVQLWQYCKLSSHAPASVQQWEVRELANGKFAVAAKYSYEVQGKTMQGDTCFTEPLFPNQFAAIDTLKKKYVQEKQEVWFDPKAKEYSSLQKKFPTMLLIRTTLALGVLVYFFFLRRYVAAKLD